MRVPLFIIGSVSLFFLLSIYPCYSFEASGLGLEFRFVHPKNDELPNCDVTVNRSDLINYEFFYEPSNHGQSAKPLWVSRYVELSGDSLVKVDAISEPTKVDKDFEEMLRQKGISISPQMTYLRLTLDSIGSKKLEEITTKHVKQRFAVIFDGKLLSVPIIYEPIKGGVVNLNGNFTKKDAEAISKKIREHGKE